MEHEKGKMYQSGGMLTSTNTVILCTGPGRIPNTFAGVVVSQQAEWSDHSIGSYSDTWTAGVFIKEFEGSLAIDNKNWKPDMSDVGKCPG